MGLLYDLFSKNKKRCTVCGCILYNDSESDICECCVDELYKSEPREVNEWGN